MTRSRWTASTPFACATADTETPRGTREGNGARHTVKRPARTAVCRRTRRAAGPPTRATTLGTVATVPPPRPAPPQPRTSRPTPAWRRAPAACSETSSRPRRDGPVRRCRRADDRGGAERHTSVGLLGDALAPSPIRGLLRLRNRGSGRSHSRSGRPTRRMTEKQVERGPRLDEPAGQEPFSAGLRMATHSTWWVIGNRSKARMKCGT